MPHPEMTILALFAIAALVAIVSQRLRIPYTIALVVAGLVIGGLNAFEAPHLSKHVLFLIVLPGLLFEAAYHMEFTEFWKSKVPIFTLAIPGLLVASALAGVGVYYGINETGLGEITFIEALVFGSLISATDPISVLSIFKTLGVNKDLYLLVEGESLFNDGAAVVIFTILLSIATGHEATVGGAMLEFVSVAGLGTLIGIAIGLGIGFITKIIHEPMIEITLTVLCAYGAFIIAEHFHYSGVIACVVAGMLMGNWGARVGMTASTRVAVISFWTYAAFVLNSFVFLLVGFEIELANLLVHAVPIVIAWSAVTLGRAAVVYGKWAILRAMGKGDSFPLSWATVLTWGGLRGGLSMVLALGLPKSFEHRELVLHLTFGVVLISLLVQGLTIKGLLRHLGLAGSATDRELYEEKTAALRATQAAVHEIDKMYKKRAIAKAVHDDVLSDYEERARQLESDIGQIHLEKSELIRSEQMALRHHLLVLEKDSIRETFQHGLIGKPAFQNLDARLDERAIALDAEGEGH